MVLSNHTQDSPTATNHKTAHMAMANHTQCGATATNHTTAHMALSNQTQCLVLVSLLELRQFLAPAHRFEYLGFVNVFASVTTKIHQQTSGNNSPMTSPRTLNYDNHILAVIQRPQQRNPRWLCAHNTEAE
jgi:hypothetical protein